MTDKELEQRNMHLVTKLISEIIYPGSECQVYNEDNTESRILDIYNSIDLIIIKPFNPCLSAQIKFRRFKHYSYFKKNKDFLLKLYTEYISSGLKYDGDYYKCQADVFLYCFLNEEENKIIYWALIDYARLKQLFIKFGGWDKIDRRYIKEITPYSDKIKDTHSISISFQWLEMNDCIIKTSEDAEQLF